VRIPFPRAASRVRRSPEGRSLLTPLCLAAAAFFLFASKIQAQDRAPRSASASADTVHVAPPTGERETDRASILAALGQAGPGDVVRFAAGTYLVGELIRVTTSHVTLIGHPDGTTLRGCAPEDFVDADVALFACNGIELAGGQQTVRDLTFEHAWHGLFVGCCFPGDMAAAEAGTSHRLDQPGGHVIEGNTFRNSSNGLRVIGQSAEPIIIRGNRFVNTFHALAINGGTAHVLGNDVSAPEPERVPIAGHTGYALAVAPTPPNEACGRNVIAGNRVEGHPDAIQVKLFVPGTRCRGTVIRDNTLVARELRYATAWGVRMGSPADSGLHGVPIAITNAVDNVAADLPPNLRRDGASVLDSTVVERNIIIGGSGLGIEVLRSSGNRIAHNTISGITRRDPFPGNTANSTDPEKAGWQEANGAGIWISPGSDRNDVVSNRIADVATYAVVLEGNENVVAGVDSASAVLDLGAANRVVSGEQGQIREPDAERLAEQVVIYRDTYGVPHVHGRTDAAAVFGLAYARAEDQFEMIEDIFINRLGRSSEVHGQEGLLTPGFAEKGHDLFVHAFGYLDEARAAYERLPAEVRSLVDAYAAGLNYYLDRNPEQPVRLLERFEPWWVVAVEDFSESHRGRAHSGAFDADAETLMRGEWRLPERGSNAWAIGPSKTADGHAMLLLNPHDPSNRPYYECHVMSDEGLNSYGGMNHFGTLILPYVGFNEHLGWSATINEPDLGDAFAMSFDHPTDSSRYRFGDAYLTARTREATIGVMTDTGVVARNVAFTETIHGPVLAKSENGRPLSFRIARAPSGTWTEQLYRMHRARSLEEWKDAVALRGLTYHNLMYADRAGNIFYLYNGNVPVRDDAFDWTAPVDGNDPRTLWQGYHTMDELPQLLNPRTGYLQNANTSPFVTTHGENPEPADFPRYMTNLEWHDNFRGHRSRELLRAAEAITLDDLHRMATSTYMRAAEEWLPDLFNEWSRLGEDRSGLRERLREPISALRAWDRESGAGSFETTLFVLWVEVYWTLWDDEYEAEDREDPELRLPIALARALDVLEREFGTWKVAWRDVFRHQRNVDEDVVAWNDDRPSYETSANHGRYGTMLNMSGAAYDGVRGSVKRRMTFGNSFVSMVEFASDGPVARSIVAYGNTMRPESPHYNDQAEMFARGLMKPVFFRMEEILANLEESYRPGELRQARSP
jgi:acyl-homoserine-lactone acylase